MHFDENLPKSNVDLRADRNFLVWVVCGVFVCSVGNIDGHTELLYFGTEGSGPLCKLSRNKKMRSVYKNGELHNALGFHIEYKAIYVKDIQSHLS
jgi:hypothetical protein